VRHSILAHPPTTPQTQNSVFSLHQASCTHVLTGHAPPPHTHTQNTHTHPTRCPPCPPTHPTHPHPPRPKRPDDQPAEPSRHSVRLADRDAVSRGEAPSGVEPGSELAMFIIDGECPRFVWGGEGGGGRVCVGRGGGGGGGGGGQISRVLRMKAQMYYVAAVGGGGVSG
jgi:hypothetical protein